jgi:hypothetical protein
MLAAYGSCPGSRGQPATAPAVAGNRAEKTPPLSRRGLKWRHADRDQIVIRSYSLIYGYQCARFSIMVPAFLKRAIPCVVLALVSSTSLMICLRTFAGTRANRHPRLDSIARLEKF